MLQLQLRCSGEKSLNGLHGQPFEIHLALVGQSVPLRRCRNQLHPGWACSTRLPARALICSATRNVLQWKDGEDKKVGPQREDDGFTLQLLELVAVYVNATRALETTWIALQLQSYCRGIPPVHEEALKNIRFEITFLDTNLLFWLSGAKFRPGVNLNSISLADLFEAITIQLAQLLAEMDPSTHRLIFLRRLDHARWRPTMRSWRSRVSRTDADNSCTAD
ncbi:MAG: hypothetical protein M1816_003252 [Peltula sp. TS41687]|nr:MAG: hypothetical protein M1816_003252 [Peltula sp. TS41687]